LEPDLEKFGTGDEKMNGVKILIWVVAVTVLLGGCAATQPQASKKDYESLCAALDQDRKGKISQQDFISGAKDKQQAARLFQLCDTNKDGYLSLEEYHNNKLAIDNLIELTPPPVVRPAR
jgi:PBP1b-binding outer membrane lipoprotein LpoB